MHSYSLYRFLEENNLLAVAKRHRKVFSKVLDKALGIRKGEILLIGDYGSKGSLVAPVMTGSYMFAAENLGINFRMVMQKARRAYDKAGKDVLEGLRRLDRKSTAIVNVSNKIGSFKDAGRSFRSLMRHRGCRFITTSGLGSLRTEDVFSIVAPYDIDYGKMRKAASSIKKRMDMGRKVRITTRAGTSLEVDIKGKISIPIDGNYKSLPSGGNMPPGEVYLAPVNRGVEGKVVIDGSSRILNGTVKVEHPITLNIRKGIVHDISGGREARLLKASLVSGMRKSGLLSNVRSIGELGIGLNPRARICGATVIDEKALGTAHIALGSNHWFGGSIRSVLHLDQVFNNPEIEIDGKRLELPKRKDLL